MVKNLVSDLYMYFCSIIKYSEIDIFYANPETCSTNRSTGLVEILFSSSPWDSWKKTQKGSEFCLAGCSNSGLFGTNSSRPIVPRQREDLYLITKYKIEVICGINFPGCSVLLGMHWGFDCFHSGGFCNVGWSCAHVCLWYMRCNYIIISVFYHLHRRCIPLPSHYIPLVACLYSAHPI